MNASTPTPWIVVPAPNPAARLRLFCFPYAGGGASIFSAWPRDLPPDIELCAVQMPGREDRLDEPPVTGWDEAVEQLAAALAPSMDRPFAFFGHSVGAALAFELGCRLRRDRRPGLIHLFVSARRAPHLPPNGPLTHDLPEEQFIRAVTAWTGTPEGVFRNRELRDLFLPILRIDVRLSETHRHAADEPLAVPISAYGGVQDNLTAVAELDEWQRHTSAGFRRVMFPGGHFFLNECRALVVSELVGELREITQSAPEHER